MLSRIKSQCLSSKQSKKLEVIFHYMMVKHLEQSYLPHIGYKNQLNR